MSKSASSLKRQVYPIPGDIKSTLLRLGLWETYQSRPPYQRNDYLGWITRAKQDVTREKRLNQMIEELKRGDRYMKMKWGVSKL